MAGDDPKNVTIDNWDNVICPKPNTGNINYIELKPVESVNYGIIYERNLTSRVPDGMNAPYGAHNYTVYLIGNSLTHLDNFLKQLIQVCDDPAHFTTNTTYEQYLIDVNNVQHLKEWKERPILNSLKRIAVLNMYTPLKYDTSHRLGDPRYNTRIGENK